MTGTTGDPGTAFSVRLEGARTAAGPRWRARLAGASIPLLVALLAYAPFVGTEFAHHDDWTALDAAAEPGFGFAFRHAAAEGRPLKALLGEVSWSLTGTVDRLGALRAISGLGVVTLAAVIAAWLRRRGLEAPLAGLAAGGAVLLGPLALFVAWAVLWSSPWAAAAAFWAGGRIADRASEGEPVAAARGPWLADVLLVAAALLVYPPSALLVLVPPMTATLLEPPPPAPAAREGGAERGSLRAVILAGLAFAAAGLVAALVAGATLRVGGLQAGERVGVVAVADGPAKAKWLLRGPLPRAADVAMSSASWQVAAAIGVLVAAGLIVGLRRRRRPVVAGLAAVALGLAGTFAATALPALDYVAYRTIAAPSLAFWLLAVLAARELSRAALPRRATHLLAAALALLVAAQAVRFRTAFAGPFVETQRRELALVRLEARRIAEARPRRIEFLQLDWRRARRPGRFSEWNGFPSAADRGSPRSMVRVAMRESGHPWDGEITLIGPGGVEGPPPAGTWRIDYADALVGAPVDAAHPSWGRMRRAPDR